MPSYSRNTTCCEPPRAWDQGKPEFARKSKYMSYTCQSLEAGLQQSRDDRATLWTTWYSKSHHMIQEGWQSLYSISNITGVILGHLEILCGSTPHTRLFLMPLPPLLRGGYLVNHICRAKEYLSLPSHLPLLAITVKIHLRPHCSSCKTSCLKEEREWLHLYLLHTSTRLWAKASQTPLQQATSDRQTEPCKGDFCRATTLSASSVTPFPQIPALTYDQHTTTPAINSLLSYQKMSLGL